MTESETAASQRSGFLRSLLSDHKALAGFVGLLVYGVVRVSYDAYYTRLGVFPEAVGLSETTILGRAALYLALTLSIAAFFGGLWLLVAVWSLERSRSRNDAETATTPIWRLTSIRLFFASLVLTLVAGGLVAAGTSLRSSLGSDHLAYYCFQRCKFAALDPNTAEDLSGLVARNPHAGYRFIDFGPEWLVVLPLGLLFVSATLGLVFGRRRGWSAGRVRPLTLFVLLSAASLTAGLLAPHLIAASEGASQSGSFVDTHPSFLKWAVFGLVLAALVTGLLAVLNPLVGREPAQSPWLIASFMLVIPLLVGFLEPNVPHFIEEEGAKAIAAALSSWTALILISFLLWPNLRHSKVKLTPKLGILLAAIVISTLMLAWLRGANLAKQAAMGDQIYAQRFSLLSVRASAVCLSPVAEGTTLELPNTPFMYLGEAGSTLVLYDYISDLANDTPKAFPVRLPAGDVIVRLAHYTGKKPFWDCTLNS
jgi:hypothetical protein